MKLRQSLVLFALALALGQAKVAPAAYAAKKKTPAPACGLALLHLIPGIGWTYRSGVQEVTVKVLEVNGGKGGTEVKVEETFGDKTQTHTWTCTAAGGLDVGPESFFFVGEPGGVVGGVAKITARENVTFLPDAALDGAGTWVQKFKGELTRESEKGAKHPPAQFEVERHATPGGTESISVPFGDYTTTRVNFELRGRGIVGEEKVEIPIKRPGAVFMAKGVGIVQIDDAFDKSWQLVHLHLPE